MKSVWSSKILQCTEDIAFSSVFLRMSVTAVISFVLTNHGHVIFEKD
jgi:hypothetical protein